MKSLSTPFRSTRARAAAVLVASALLYTACARNAETDVSRQNTTDEQALRAYFTSNRLSPRPLPVGDATAYFQKLDSNATGTVVATTSVVRLAYRVSVLGGALLQTDTVLMRANAVVPLGLSAGLRLMRSGERFRFFIPSSLAFATYRNDSVGLPANANLLLDATVVALRTDAEQSSVEATAIQQYARARNLIGPQETARPLVSGVYYFRTQPPTDTNTTIRPGIGRTAGVSYTLSYLSGPPIASGQFSFEIKATNLAVVPGFQAGILAMRQGERGRLLIPSQLGYGATLQVVPGKIRRDLIAKTLIRDELPPFSTLVFDPLELRTVQ